jgi:hypothetical protein
MQSNETLTITVRGPVGFRFERPTVMLVSFAERDPRVPDPKDELGWVEFGNPAALTFQFGAALQDSTWSGTVPLPSPAPSPVRVVVRELELYERDEDTAAVTLPGKDPLGQPVPDSDLFDLPRFRTRMVFVDALELP